MDEIIAYERMLDQFAKIVPAAADTDNVTAAEIFASTPDKKLA